MQIFFLSKGWMIALCFILWPIFQVSIVLICLKIPDEYFSPEAFFYKEHKWERGGRLYENVFKVKKWKRFLPDGGAAIKGGYRKKHLLNYSRVNLERFLIESCRGELSHLLSIFPFWIFGLFTPPIVIFYMFIYALLVNLPCIIVQRYNRPRFLKVLESRFNKI